MDLYYVMTNYHVLCAILHKIVFNKERKAVLWVSSYLVDNQPEVFESLKKSNFFDKVIEYQEIGFLYFGDMKVNRKMSDEELEIIDDNIDRERIDDLKTFDNLYICQDTHSLGIYLNKHKMKYNFFEDGCGILSNKGLLLSLVEKFPAVYKIVDELKCIGESSNVVHRYGDLSEQAEGYYNEKDIDFSVKKILMGLDEEDVNRIFKVYNCKRYDLKKKKKDLLLTWKYNNAGLMSLDEQREFFALLLDYFHDESAALFIKPHPFDIQPVYEQWYKGAVILERNMPSELLMLAVDGGFDRGITNWSTSIFGLREILKDIINFDKRIDDTYRDFHKYYAVIKYLEIIKKKNSIQEVVLDGVNEIQFMQLLRHHFKNYDKYFSFVDKGDGIYVVGEYREGLKNKKCIIMSGAKGFSPQSVVSITAGGDGDCIYFYNLSDEDLNFEKKMKYSGYVLHVASCDVSSYANLLIEELRKKKDEIKTLEQESQEKISILKEKVSNYRSQRDILRTEVDGMLNSSSWRLTKPLRKLNSVRKK